MNTFGNETIWRITGAALGAALVYFAMAVGLAVGGVVDVVLVGLFAGIVAGALSPSLVGATISSVVPLAAGVLVLPPWLGRDNPLLLVMLVIVGTAVAVVVHLLSTMGLAGMIPLTAVALAALIASTVFVASTVVRTPQPDTGLTKLQGLEVQPVAGQTMDDGEFYRAVVWKMRRGAGYLDAFRSAYQENARWKGEAPHSVLGVRTPVLFEIWAKAPGGPHGPFWLLFSIALLGMAAAPVVIHRAVPPVLGVAGAASLIVYVFGYAFTPGLLFLSEIWAGVAAVLVFAAFSLAQREGAGRGWMVAAALIATVAALTRELMVFLLIAGLLAAFLGPKARRRFDVTVWATALASFAIAWGLLLMSARRIVTPIAGKGFEWIQNGGLDNLYSGIISSTGGFGTTWIPVALAVCAILGALAQPDRQFRVFATAAIVMPFVGFLFVGTDATVYGTNIPYNYWGGIVMPAVVVMAPAALAWIPGMRADSSVPSDEDGETARA